jgi:hypothetical protein
MTSLSLSLIVLELEEFLASRTLVSILSVARFLMANEIIWFFALEETLWSEGQY